jgi:hypothetical protein
MFRLGVIIRVYIEPYRRYIKYSAHFGIPKSSHLKIQVKLLQYYCFNVLYTLFIQYIYNTLNYYNYYTIYNINYCSIIVLMYYIYCLYILFIQYK